MWCEPVHCSSFSQYHHDTCTIADPITLCRSHFSFYAGTLIWALPKCVSRNLSRYSRATSHRSNVERLSFQTARASVLIDAKSAALTKKRWRPLWDSNQHVPDSLTFQGAFGIVKWNLRLNSLWHLPFVLKWAYEKRVFPPSLAAA